MRMLQVATRMKRKNGLANAFTDVVGTDEEATGERWDWDWDSAVPFCDQTTIERPGSIYPQKSLAASTCDHL